MNICFINPTKILRGGIKGLSKELTSRGHIITILTPTQPDKRDLIGLDSITIQVYPSFFIPKIRYTIPNFFSQYKILHQINHDNRIDVIHIWTYFYLAIWIPWLFGKFNHIPVVITTDSFPGISWNYGSKFVNISAKIYSISIGKLILRSCDKVILLHSKIKGDAVKLGIKNDNINIIPNGVDENYFNINNNPNEIRQQLGINPDQKMILNVGRLVPVKGIDTLIKITEELLKDDLNFKMVIVGDGPYREKYKMMAKHLAENVIFTGFRRDISELISACDVFVLPSLSEGLPNVLLEAGALGKPMVASNVGGIPDIIIHGKTGLLAPPKDAALFAKHIETILNNQNFNNLDLNAPKYVKENFNWNEIGNKVEEIYEQVRRIE